VTRLRVRLWIAAKLYRIAASLYPTPTWNSTPPYTAGGLLQEYIDAKKLPQLGRGIDWDGAAVQMIGRWIRAQEGVHTDDPKLEAFATLTCEGSLKDGLTLSRMIGVIRDTVPAIDIRPPFCLMIWQGGDRKVCGLKVIGGREDTLAERVQP